MEPDGIRECPYCERFFEVPEVAEVRALRASVETAERQQNALTAEVVALTDARERMQRERDTLRARAEAAEEEAQVLRKAMERMRAIRGGQGLSADCADITTAALARPRTAHSAGVEAKGKAVKRLVDFAQSFAECPCCGRSDECEADCTFAEDNGDPESIAVANMEAAREALRTLAEAERATGAAAGQAGPVSDA